MIQSKDKPKLGRGLGDVSSYFLSRTREKEDDAPCPLPAAPEDRSVAVGFTGSGSLQAGFISNLALEAVKRRYPVIVRDRSATEGTCVRDVMQSVLSPDESNPGTSHVRMYGLPDIIIKEDSGNETEGTFPGTESGIVVKVLSAPLSLDSLGQHIPDDFIIIAGTDGKSLLKAYAFIKAGHVRSSAARFHLIFAAGPGHVDEKTLFRRFSIFTENFAGCTVNYLGSLVQDKQWEGSIAESKPLVLSGAGSESRDSVMGICSRFLDGALLQAGKDGNPCAS